MSKNYHWYKRTENVAILCNDVFRCTEKRIQFLRDKGYRVVTIWECQRNKMKKDREIVKSFMESLEMTDPLDPLDAFCGGRTNAIKLVWVIKW